MANVSIDNLSKRYDRSVLAVDQVSLQIENGEFIVLLGPSGCGKTTTLRCIAGLENPTEGHLVIGEREVFDAERKVNLPPNKRDIGMVFQSYALWPHLTVRRNIEYPLRARRMREALSQGWTETAAELVGCSHLLNRHPAQLSGGQQQRVALARSFVARPGLVLFDEPLSNLDTRLRDQVRQELHELHSRVGFTAVFVTHDQSEALALGDRLVIMREGRIEQVGTPREVYERPTSEYVADFLGQTNRLECRQTGSGFEIEGLALSGGTPCASVDAPQVAIRMRPEAIRLHDAERVVPGRSHLPAKLVDWTYAGSHLDVVVTVGEARVSASVGDEESRDAVTRRSRGDAIWISFAPAEISAFAMGVGEPARAQIADRQPELSSSQ